MKNFRDLLIAAPLKLNQPSPASGRHCAFPRSADRGPIEATIIEPTTTT